METKKCKHCQSDIPKAARVCPQCGRKQGGILKWVLIAIVFFFVVGAVFGNSEDEESSSTAETESVSEDSSDTASADTKKPKTEKKKKKIEYTSYSVSELDSDLESNALAASDKYKGQYVELTGRMGTIDSDGSYISVKDPDNEWDLIGVQCYIKNDEQLDVIKSLSTDSTICVKGKITDVGEVMGYSLDIDEISAAE